MDFFYCQLRNAHFQGFLLFSPEMIGLSCNVIISWQSYLELLCFACLLYNVVIQILSVAAWTWVIFWCFISSQITVMVTRCLSQIIFIRFIKLKIFSDLQIAAAPRLLDGDCNLNWLKSLMDIYVEFYHFTPLSGVSVQSQIWIRFRRHIQFKKSPNSWNIFSCRLSEIWTI